MIRDIKICVVMNGYYVRVGCQAVVFETMPALLEALRGYLTDPEGTEKRFGEHPNARHTLNGPAMVGAEQTCERAFAGDLLQTDRRYTGDANGRV